jgi:hypothetical protein
VWTAKPPKQGGISATVTFSSGVGAAVAQFLYTEMVAGSIPAPRTSQCSKVGNHVGALPDPLFHVSSSGGDWGLQLSLTFYSGDENLLARQLDESLVGTR